MAVTTATRSIPFNLPNPAPIQEPTQVLSDDGAITIPAGQVWLTKASASAITLAAPGANGLRLKITSRTAAAHTVTVSGGADGSGSSTDVGTFGGAAYDHVELVSQGGVWCIASKLNVTFA